MSKVHHVANTPADVADSDNDHRSSQAEGRIICEANPIIPAVAFGFPDCTSHSGKIVFDEAVNFDIFFREHLWLLYKLTRIFGVGPILNFGPIEIDALRQTWAQFDAVLHQLEDRLTGLGKMSSKEIEVRHEWHGNWRPKDSKAYATVLLGEAIAGEPLLGWCEGHRAIESCGVDHVLHWTETNDIAIILHTRLQIELAAGRLDRTDPVVASVLVQARERARRALKGIARSITHWMSAPRKHATFANIFSYMVNLPDWIELALARYGEPGGPVHKADELR